jgi:N-glycosylase/DNA lyase
MTMKTRQTRQAALRLEFELRRDAIRQRLAEFAAVPREQYYYELVYCLLTPQSSAVNAGKVIQLLQQNTVEHNHRQLTAILSRKEHYIRFHNTKSLRIEEAKRIMPEVMTAIVTVQDGSELRAWLAGHVKGLGWKESSHFLRNIGYRNLAILDRHILRNLREQGVVRALPRSLTRLRYLEIEQRFLEFAETIGISMDELDLLFWSRETGVILK